MNEFFILSSRECILMLFGDAMKICNIAARLYTILTVLIAGFFMTFFFHLVTEQIRWRPL